MVNYREPDLDSTFAALSDPTRRGIVTALSQGEASVGELAAPFAISLPAISKHLRVLERARLIETRRAGRIHRCRLKAETMRDAFEWIGRYREFWNHQFDSLEKHLAQSASDANHSERKGNSSK